MTNPRIEMLRFDCGKHVMGQAQNNCPWCEIERLRGILEIIAGGTNDTVPPFRAMPASVMSQAARAVLDRRSDEPEPRSPSASERLHNICDALSEHADESPFTREEWDRIDKETTRLQENVRIASHALGAIAGGDIYPQKLAREALDLMRSPVEPSDEPAPDLATPKA